MIRLRAPKTSFSRHGAMLHWSIPPSAAPADRPGRCLACAWRAAIQKWPSARTLHPTLVAAGRSQSRAEVLGPSRLGQRHVSDRGVEHLHKTCERDQDGDQPGIGAGATCRGGSIGFDDGSAHRYLLSFSTSDDMESTRTVGTTDMPGPSATSAGGLSMMIFTGTRWTILT